MAQDEGRFGRINDVRRSWAPKGKRPVAPRQIVREYVYAFVAVCPALGRMSSLVLPWADTAMMNIFLAHTADEFKDYFILMLMDRAGWHTSRKLKVPENIRIIPLPPHSPELNPTEHVWPDLRSRKFHNTAHHSLDTVEDALCDGLMDLADDSKRLRSLTNFPYMHVTV